MFNKERKRMMKEFLKELENENKLNKNVCEERCESYQEKIDKMSPEELMQELIRPIDGEEKINIEDLEIYDVAATPEEIAEEERKKNSYFNY